MSESLKKITPLLLIVFIILSAVFAYLWQKEKSKKPDGPITTTWPATSDQDSCKAYAQKWKEIERSYQNYVDTLVAHSKVRNAINIPAKPVDIDIAKAYMGSYRTSLTTGSGGSNNIKSILFTKDELGFYIKYLDMHPEIKYIQASLGRYDKSALPPHIRDTLLEQNMNRNMHYTLLMGTPNLKPSTIDYSIPFIVDAPAGKQQSFYDDWHDTWP